MQDTNQFYTHVTITENRSDCEIKLETIARHGDSRKTKIKNNFSGLLEAANGATLRHLCEQLSKDLPDYSADQVVVGMYKSGIPMATALAMVRESRFNWTTPDALGDYSRAICFREDHRDDKAHYLYGILPGDSVILIEDEVTTGKGIIGLALELRSSGVEVIAICSILETVNFNGRTLIRDQLGLELVSLIKVELS